jgi:murein DD-endopeptidase MepM/ murein hydrolase activator NlpD
MDRSWRTLFVLVAASVVVGCSTPKGPASGEQRPAPGPGYYVVQPGDTLYRIASKAGRSTRDIARWNELGDADRLEVGQVLRVVPPGASPGAANRHRESREEQAKVPPPASPPAGPKGDWSWPAAGPVVGGFNGTSNKGVDIGGKLGDPVLAMGKGVVVAAEEMRGYGTVLMVDHGGSYMSVYAHVRTLLVKKGQTVSKGQKIAEMGYADADRIRLHFEIRRGGNAVDPRQYLPGR